VVHPHEEDPSECSFSIAHPYDPILPYLSTFLLDKPIHTDSELV
jgi:hypothetical protein